ncbi:MAG TPA: rhomboid family intramembrane serine protease [Polyangiaceae bacterium]|jgi:membrane associated rhomboid family serine protease|nr:rhomboid family intramembrane serine protease [Polyangiaceae bacterium]
MSKGELTAIKRELKLQATLLFGFVGLLWAIEIVDAVLFQGSLDRFGVRPRSMEGLVGVAFAPLLHMGFGHLIANTLPLITLGWLIMLRETRDLVVVTVLAALVSGLGTWLIGASHSVHIGASGVIFGYFGFLLLRGYFERSILSIGLSLAVAAVYGGMLWGVLPSGYRISWEGHLFGFLGGVLAARMLSRRAPAKSPARRA